MNSPLRSSLLLGLALLAASRASAAPDSVRLTHRSPVGDLSVTLPDETCRVAVLHVNVLAHESVQGNLLVVGEENGRLIGTSAFYSTGHTGSRSGFVFLVPRELRREAKLSFALRASNPARPLTSGDVEVSASANCDQRDNDTIPVVSPSCTIGEKRCRKLESGKSYLQVCRDMGYPRGKIGWTWVLPVSECEGGR